MHCIVAFMLMNFLNVNTVMDIRRKQFVVFIYRIYQFYGLINIIAVLTAGRSILAEPANECTVETKFPSFAFESQPDKNLVYLRVDELKGQSALQKCGLHKFASVFGVRVVADRDVSNDRVLYVASILAKLLDVTEEGHVRSDKLVQTLREGYSMLVILSNEYLMRSLLDIQKRCDELKCFPRAFHISLSNQILPHESQEENCPVDLGVKDRSLGFVSDFIVSMGYPYGLSDEYSMRSSSHKTDVLKQCEGELEAIHDESPYRNSGQFEKPCINGVSIDDNKSPDSKNRHGMSKNETNAVNSDNVENVLVGRMQCEELGEIMNSTNCKYSEDESSNTASATLEQLFQVAVKEGWINGYMSGCNSDECVEIAFQSWALSSALGADRCFCEAAKEWHFCTPRSLQFGFPALWQVLAKTFALHSSLPNSSIGPYYHRIYRSSAVVRYF